MRTTAALALAVLLIFCRQALPQIRQEATGTDLPAVTYVLNRKTRVFHKPDCLSVREIKQKNREDVTLTREEIIENGYRPCRRCYP